MDVAQQVRDARSASGLTQRALAERCGIAQPHIARIESGKVVPTQATLEALLQAARPPARDVLARHRDDILAIVLRHRGTGRVQVFGSVARGDDGPDSDIDLLVEFEEGADYFDLHAMQEELASLVGRTVDVLSARGSGRATRSAHQQAVPL